MNAHSRKRLPACMLLLAAMSMVLQAACSHAPHPGPNINPRDYEGEGVVVRFHTTDNITYVTSSYAVTDSSIVIRNILRDTKYYNPLEMELNEPAPTAPAAGIALPIDLPIKNIRYMDRWEPIAISENKTKGTLVVVGIVAGFVAAMAIAISQAN